MPLDYATIKARREADPEYAERLKRYARAYVERNKDKEKERQRLSKSLKRETDRAAYNAYMREYNKVKVYPGRLQESEEKRKAHPEYEERVSTRSQLTKQEYSRHWKMKQQYGIGIFEYRDMYESQKGQCAICGNERPDHGKQGLVIDHCHTHGHVRKLLCVHCNTGLGQFKDDAALLQKAIGYLTETAKGIK